ncbi:MAG: hypothetical protein KGY99_06700 [Phycisphaerae bacterium]|nr:hypothetical protein [Phycisphaerae bacterium]
MPSTLTPGKIAVGVGLLLVLLGRGCDSIASRGVLRANARADNIKAEFDGDWEPKMREARDAISDADNVEQRSKARERLEKVEKEKSEARKDIQEDLDKARSKARIAATSAAMRAYWYEWMFVIGSIVLVAGLLTTAASGTWPERIVCFVMLAIIAFSIYIGGVAWLGSTATTIKGLS